MSTLKQSYLKVRVHMHYMSKNHSRLAGALLPKAVKATVSIAQTDMFRFVVYSPADIIEAYSPADIIGVKRLLSIFIPLFLPPSPFVDHSSLAIASAACLPAVVQLSRALTPNRSNFRRISAPAHVSRRTYPPFTSPTTTDASCESSAWPRCTLIEWQLRRRCAYEPSFSEKYK